MSHFKKKLYKIAEILKKEVQLHPDKVVMWRSTLPQHFDGMNVTSDGYYTGLLLYKACIKETFKGIHWTNIYMEQVSSEYGFKFLNTAPLYMDRWDLHFSTYVAKSGNVDCTHSCYTPEVLAPEIALMNQLL